MPATILLIIQGIQAAISAAPGVIDIVDKAKALISSLFGAGVITVEQQNALHAHIDSLAALAAAGIVPDYWRVQPDPPTLVTAPPPPPPGSPTAPPLTPIATVAAPSTAVGPGNAA